MRAPNPCVERFARWAPRSSPSEFFAIITPTALAIFAVWGNNNGLFDSLKDIETLKTIARGELDPNEMGSALRSDAAMANETSGGITNAWSIGLAGLLLAMSAFVSGWRMSPFAIVATLVILLGPAFGIPGFGELLQPWMVAGLAGVVVYLPGIIFGETGVA